LKTFKENRIRQNWLSESRMEIDLLTLE